MTKVKKVRRAGQLHVACVLKMKAAVATLRVQGAVATVHAYTEGVHA